MLRPRTATRGGLWHANDDVDSSNSRRAEEHQVAELCLEQLARPRPATKTEQHEAGELDITLQQSDRDEGPHSHDRQRRPVLDWLVECPAARDPPGFGQRAPPIWAPGANLVEQSAKLVLRATRMLKLTPELRQQRYKRANV